MRLRCLVRWKGRLGRDRAGLRPRSHEGAPRIRQREASVSGGALGRRRQNQVGLRGLKGSKDLVKGVCFHVNHRRRLFTLEAGHSCSAPGEPRGAEARFPGSEAGSHSALGGASSHFCFAGRTRASCQGRRGQLHLNRGRRRL